MKVVNEINGEGSNQDDMTLVVENCASGYHKVRLRIMDHRNSTTALPTFLEIEVDGDKLIRAANNAMND